MSEAASASVSVAAAASPRKGVPRFSKLKNVTPAAVNALFTPVHNPTSVHPVLIIAVGSPGVGKTSTLKKILNNEPLLEDLGITYNHFYNISLDTLVEHVQPYRNLTRKVHNEYKAAKKINYLRTNPNNTYYNYELSNSDYGDFSTMYLQMIRSDQPNFSLEAEEARLRGKLQLPEMVIPRKHTNTPIKQRPIKQSPIKQSPGGFEIVLDPKDGKEKCKCPNCGGLYAGEATPKKHKEQGCPPSSRRSTVTHADQKGGSLKTMLDDAIERAIASGYNIIYDTTFGGNTNKVDNIMDILIKHPTHKYKIFIIHIAASESEIVERIKRRHLHMIAHYNNNNKKRSEENRYLRAIRSTLTKKYITENKLGFYSVRKKYTNPKDAIFKNKKYSPEDFIFKAFINPEGKEPVINQELMSMSSSRHNQEDKNMDL